MKEGTKVKIFLSLSLGIHLFLFIIFYTLFPEFKVNFVSLPHPRDIDILLLPTIEVSPKEKIVLEEVVKRNTSMKNPLPIENEKIIEPRQEEVKKNTNKIENEDKERNEFLQQSMRLAIEEKKYNLTEVLNDTDKENKENISKPHEIEQKTHDEKSVMKKSVSIALNITQSTQKDLIIQKEELLPSESPKQESAFIISDIPKINISKENGLEIKSYNSKNIDQEVVKPSVTPFSFPNDENDLKELGKVQLQKSEGNISSTEAPSKMVKLNPERNSILTQPRYINNPKPKYPSEARRRGYEGEVVLRVEVLANGYVGGIELKRSSGHKLLDQSAMEAVKQWKFIPAMKDGEPIDLWVNIPIKFQLK